MQCEICGRDVSRESFKVKIEGSVMKTCKSCSRLGESVYERKPIQKQGGHSYNPRIQKKETVLEIVDDCAKLVRVNREKKGFTQDQLGAKINEKGSVISRIESGHMEPDSKTAKKLERLFDISLLEEIEE